MAINWITRTVDNLTELRTAAGVPNSAAKMRVLGHTTANRGGGGVFHWRTGTPPTDDNGINIVVTGVTSGWWQRNFTGNIYPRYFGAAGDNTTNDTTAWIAAIAYAAPLLAIIDGEGKSYKIGGMDLTSYQGAKIQHANFTTTSGTYGIKNGDVGQPPTIYRRTFSLTNVKFTGSCTYAMIVSTITDVIINNVKFQNMTCANDVLYLSNIYDAEIKRLTFIATNVGTGCACINMDAGVNGIAISNIYTSAFTDYGIKIKQNSSLVFGSNVLQGHKTAVYISGCNGAIFHNMYFENVVNQLDIDNSFGEVNNIMCIGGAWGGPYPSHPQLASNNGVFVRYVGSRSQVYLQGGTFDVNGTSAKKLASVGGSAVMNINNPILSDGTSGPQIRTYLFKEVGAISTAGYYLTYNLAGNNTQVTVKRNGDFNNRHVVEYYDTSNNLIRTIWAPLTVGDTATQTDSPYVHSINATPKAASYNLTTEDQTILFDTSASNLNANLPVNASVPAGKLFYIKKYTGNNTLTIRSVDGSKTVDGLSSFVLYGAGDSALVQYDGTNYIVVTSHINEQRGTPTISTTISGATVTVSGTNTSGTITLTLASTQSLAALGAFFTFTFSNSYTSSGRPRIIFSPAENANSAGLANIYIKSPSATSWQLASGPGGSISAGTYIWDYIIHQ